MGTLRCSNLARWKYKEVQYEFSRCRIYYVHVDVCVGALSGVRRTKSLSAIKQSAIFMEVVHGRELLTETKDTMLNMFIRVYVYSCCFLMVVHLNSAMHH